MEEAEALRNERRKEEEPRFRKEGYESDEEEGRPRGARRTWAGKREEGPGSAWTEDGVAVGGGAVEMDDPAP